MMDFFLTYHLATCCMIFVDDVTELIQSRHETAIEEHFKQLSNASIGFTRTTLSATVSKYVEKNQYVFKLARLLCSVQSVGHCLTHQNMSIAMHSIQYVQSIEKMFKVKVLRYFLCEVCLATLIVEISTF